MWLGHVAVVAVRGVSELELEDLTQVLLGGVVQSIQGETQSQQRREAAVRDERTSSVPEPIPAQAPGGFAAAGPLPDLIRRIIREELRPIHLLLEERGDRSTGGAASGAGG